MIKILVSVLKLGRELTWRIVRMSQWVLYRDSKTWRMKKKDFDSLDIHPPRYTHKCLRAHISLAKVYKNEKNCCRNGRKRMEMEGNFDIFKSPLAASVTKLQN